MKLFCYWEMYSKVMAQRDMIKEMKQQTSHMEVPRGQVNNLKLVS